jgi:hypothetical protein
VVFGYRTNVFVMSARLLIQVTPSPQAFDYS